MNARSDNIGERRPNAVLTDAKVRAIRKAYRAGQSIGSLAREHGVVESTMSAVCHYRSWRHVEELYDTTYA